MAPITAIITTVVLKTTMLTYAHTAWMVIIREKSGQTRASIKNGEMCSGWLLENSALAARVPREHSETAWLTTRGIEFIEAQNTDHPGEPWLCHLSYIKPHWPYLAPAPYNDMYSANDLPPVNRSDDELTTDHPLMQRWIGARIAKSFSRDEVRNIVAPVYMGLIKELDDQIGRLFKYLESAGRLDDTMVVFCSDHGDNMGDHWMGEKDLFFDCSARTPLIVYDPRESADVSRVKVCNELVEGIDLAPTFMEFYGGPAKPHIIEGRSLQPLLHRHQVQLTRGEIIVYPNTITLHVKHGVSWVWISRMPGW